MKIVNELKRMISGKMITTIANEIKKIKGEGEERVEVK